MLDLASGISGVKLLAFDTDSGNTYVASSSLGAVCQLTRTGGMFSRRWCTRDAYAIAMQLLPLQLCLKIDLVLIHQSSVYFHVSCFWIWLSPCTSYSTHMPLGLGVHQSLRGGSGQHDSYCFCNGRTNHQLIYTRLCVCCFNQCR